MVTILLLEKCAMKFFQNLMIILIQLMRVNQFMRVDKVTTRVMATYVAPARIVLTSLLMQVNEGSRAPKRPEIDPCQRNVCICKQISKRAPWSLTRQQLGLHTAPLYILLQHAAIYLEIYLCCRMATSRPRPICRLCDHSVSVCVFLILRKFGKDEERHTIALQTHTKLL